MLSTTPTLYAPPVTLRQIRHLDDFDSSRAPCRLVYTEPETK